MAGDTWIGQEEAEALVSKAVDAERRRLLDEFVVLRAGPQPINDPQERRAICLKLAIETKTWVFQKDDGVEEAAGAVVAAARIFEAYVAGGLPAGLNHPGSDRWTGGDKKDAD